MPRSPQGIASTARLGGFAQVAQSGLSGRDGAQGETRFRLGLTLSIGQSGGVAVRPVRFAVLTPSRRWCAGACGSGLKLCLPGRNQEIATLLSSFRLL